MVQYERGDSWLKYDDRIPFKLSFGLAVFINRKEKKRLEMETKEVDEETPLLA